MPTDPAYLKAFKEFTRENPTFDDLPAMEREFYGASDRAAAVLQAAVVEVALETAIKKKLRPDLSNEFMKELFLFEGTIGSFSDKITMAYALGIFGNDTFQDLIKIRMLRNAFAHNRKPLRFEIKAIASMCKHLRIPDVAGIAHAPHAYFEHAQNISAATDIKNPKTRYITACHSISVQLLLYANDTSGEFSSAMLP